MINSQNHRFRQVYYDRRIWAHLSAGHVRPFGPDRAVMLTIDGRLESFHLRTEEVTQLPVPRAQHGSHPFVMTSDNEFLFCHGSASLCVVVHLRHLKPQNNQFCFNFFLIGVYSVEKSAALGYLADGWCNELLSNSIVQLHAQQLWLLQKDSQLSVFNLSSLEAPQAGSEPVLLEPYKTWRIDIPANAPLLHLIAVTSTKLYVSNWTTIFELEKSDPTFVHQLNQFATPTLFRVLTRFSAPETLSGRCKSRQRQRNGVRPSADTP
jgi:hypothetical protein